MTAVVPNRRKGARPDDPELRGRRSEMRACLVLPASAEAISGLLNVTLLDVSMTGARVEGFRLPAAGKDIVLRCGSVDAFGTIAWAASGRCGIHFEEPVTVEQLSELRAMAAEADSAPMTVAERQACDDWLNGLAR